MGTGKSFMEIKGLGREADQSPAYNAENESQWLYTPFPRCMSSWHDFTSTFRGLCK